MRPLLAAALLLAACSPAEVDQTAEVVQTNDDLRACEAFIKGGLDAPDTYRLLSVDRSDAPIGIDQFLALRGIAPDDSSRIFVELEAEKGLKLRTLTVKSASDGGDGLPAERTDRCVFKLVAGKLEKTEDLDRRVEEALGNVRLRGLARQGLVAGVSPEQVEPAAECCVGAPAL